MVNLPGLALLPAAGSITLMAMAVSAAPLDPVELLMAVGCLLAWLGGAAVAVRRWALPALARGGMA